MRRSFFIYYDCMKLPGIFTIEFDNKRTYGLDIIRALAILFVVLGHSTDLIPKSYDKRLFYLIPFPDGVAVFFVLSGFLIGGILIKVLEKEPPSLRVLFHFWQRRWYRTLPAYYFILLTLLLLNILFTKNFNTAGTGRYFIFFQNFTTPHPVFFVEAWSLSVEEWFYLLIPSFLFAGVMTGRVKPKQMILIAIITVVTLTILFRYYRYLTVPPASEQAWGAVFRGQVITRLDNIMFGLLGAYLAYYYKALWLRYKKPLFYIAIGLLLLTKLLGDYLLPTSVFYFCNVSFLLTELAVLMAFPLMSEIKTGSGIVYRFLTFISLISYSMYLTHASLLLHWTVNELWYAPPANIKMVAARYILFWIVVFPVSTLLYKYIELPFIRYRDKHVKAER